MMEWLAPTIEGTGDVPVLPPLQSSQQRPHQQAHYSQHPQEHHFQHRLEPQTDDIFEWSPSYAADGSDPLHPSRETGHRGYSHSDYDSSTHAAHPQSHSNNNNRPTLALALDGRPEGAGYCNAGSNSETDEEPWWTSSSEGTAVTPSPQNSHEPSLRPPQSLHTRHATVIPDVTDFDLMADFTVAPARPLGGTGADPKRRKLSLENALEGTPAGLMPLGAPSSAPAARGLALSAADADASKLPAPKAPKAASAGDKNKSNPSKTPSPPPSQQSHKTGRWSDKEHQLFLQGLQAHGRNWKLIADHVGTRSHIQIRTHAQKYFIKEQKSGATNINSSDQSDTSSLLKRRRNGREGVDILNPTASDKQEPSTAQTKEIFPAKQSSQTNASVPGNPKRSSNTNGVRTPSLATKRSQGPSPSSSKASLEMGRFAAPGTQRHLDLPKIERPASALEQFEDIHSGHHKGGRLDALIRVQNDQRAGKRPPGNIVEAAFHSRDATVLGSNQERVAPEVTLADNERDEAMLGSDIFDDPMESNPFDDNDFMPLPTQFQHSQDANALNTLHVDPSAAAAAAGRGAPDEWLADTTTGSAAASDHHRQHAAHTAGPYDVHAPLVIQPCQAPQTEDHFSQMLL